MTSLDDIARELDRARAAHERRPEDARLYQRFLDARIAFLEAEVDVLRHRLTREQARSVALARALAKRRAGHEAALRTLRDLDDGRASRARRAAPAPCPGLFDGLFDLARLGEPEGAR